MRSLKSSIALWEHFNNNNNNNNHRQWEKALQHHPVKIKTQQQNMKQTEGTIYKRDLFRLFFVFPVKMSFT